MKSTSWLCSFQRSAQVLRAAAGDVQDQPEEFPAQLLDARLPVGDPAGVEVHEVVPAPGEVAARGDLDDRAFGEAVRRAAAGGEHVHVHAGRQLQRAADEVACRRGGEDQPALPGPELLARRQHVRDGRRAALHDRAHGLLGDVGEAARLVARRRVGGAVDPAALEVAVVPAQLAHDGLGHLGRGGAAGELLDGVAHLGVLAEHHGGAGTHQQVGREAHRRVGGEAREGVAAAALHAHDQLAGREGLAPAGVRGARDAACALATMSSSIDMNPTWLSACRQIVSGPRLASRPSTIGKEPGGSSRSGWSFSQPRLTTITSPPKFGLREMCRSVRMGMTASGASMATPQP